MAKKCLICGLAAIILLLCCGMCFAADNEKEITLGNEIMKSIDKTGDSFQNVVSGNVVQDTANTMKDGMHNMGNSVRDMGDEVTGTINNMDNNDRNNNNNRSGEVIGNYNAERTSTTADTINSGINTMSATTWMWIILIVAALIIMVAIWYYATQSNS